MTKLWRQILVYLNNNVTIVVRDVNFSNPKYCLFQFIEFIENTKLFTVIPLGDISGGFYLIKYRNDTLK